MIGGMNPSSRDAAPGPARPAWARPPRSSPGPRALLLQAPPVAHERPAGAETGDERCVPVELLEDLLRRAVVVRGRLAWLPY